MRPSDGERPETPPSCGLPHNAGPGESGEQPQCGLGDYAEVLGQTFGGNGRLPQHEVDGVGKPAALVGRRGQRCAGRGSALQSVELLHAGAGGFGHQGQKDPGPRG
jgi:hypothetical protein